MPEGLSSEASTSSTVTNEYRHIPVLLAECLEALAPQTHPVFVDATLGFAGHSLEVAKRLGKDGLLIGIDQDEEAISYATAKLMELPETIRPEIKILHGNFGELDELLVSACVPGIDSILFDLGLSSVQIDTPARGFAFKNDSPLDMRMDPSKQTTNAKEIINNLNAPDLARIIRTNSDEKWASRIADFIVRAREEAPIETSSQLVEIIKAAVPASARRAGGHPAKRTFQALRMEVNQEVPMLKRGLDAAVRWLNPNGVLCAISYHSIEDRIVKDTFASFANRCVCPPDLPVCACGKEPILEVETRKPILPTKEEIEENAKARSAKLRVARKLQTS